MPRIVRTVFIVAIIAAPALAGDDAPTAHGPQFDRAELWPGDVNKARYAREKWEPARRLVWARQGDYTGEISDPANWLEGGNHARRGPDESTDLLIPDMPESVRIQGGDALHVRHLTVGRRIDFRPRHVKAVTGNIWIREGSYLRTRSFKHFGPKHTFIRSDSLSKTKGMTIDKDDGATVEMVGEWETADWFQVDRGILVIGPGTFYGGGRRHQSAVGPEGTMVVLSGATFTTRKGKPWAYDLDLYGRLLVGTPRRPLTADVLFLLNHKPRTIGRSNPQDRTLQTRPGSRFVVHSADPAKFRLIIRRRGEDVVKEAREPDAIDDLLGAGQPREDAEKEKQGKLDFRFLGDLKLNGVVFEDVAKGGIQVRDPSVRKKWTRVTFGRGCAGEPAELFAKADRAQDANGSSLLEYEAKETPKR